MIKKYFFKLFITLFVVLSVISAGYAQNLRWAKMPLLVCLPPNSNSAIMKQAFSDWQKATKDKVTFNFLTANSCPNAQITVSYAPNKKSSLTTFSYLSTGYLTKAHIEMGLLTQQGNLSDKTLLLNLMKHEIGHAIGIIGHTNTQQSLMQGTVKTGYKITPDTLTEINRLYK